MKRTPEPELMDESTQAAAYAEADFDEPNAAFVARVLDLAA
ncbi:MAG: class I SAM-dependent methyltransferase, partial [Myxococcota bacterium]